MKCLVRHTLIAIFSLTLTMSAWSRDIVALMTDFGLNNEAVGLCHGAILSHDSDIEIVDLCHNVDAYDIKQAALVLRGASAFPKGTVFVCVVDPGVGTKREPIALKTRAGYFYVAPDNGLLTYVIQEQGIEEVVIIDPKRVNPRWKAGTFDGRDLFSPAGAILAQSKQLDRIGQPVEQRKLIRFEIERAQVDSASHSITGRYLRTDQPYGNVWTNISEEDLAKADIQLRDHLEVTAGGKTIKVPFVVSFGHVEEGEPLAYISSSGVLSLAVNMGNFAEKYELKEGAEIRVKKASSQPSPVTSNSATTSSTDQ